MQELRDEPVCLGCRALLLEPYIQCAACSPNSHQKTTLCLHCFARGVEFDGHESNHPYCIVKNNFPVFERHWTALEETQLVKAITDCGYGNWLDVAHQVRTKTPAECERHYNHCYIDNRHSDLPDFEERELASFPSPLVYKLSEDPPRPAEGSLVSTEMAGYMAARGDFITEFDNFIEMDLRQLEFTKDEEEDTLETDLKLAVLDIYQRCLRERYRRKRLVRKYGLVNLRNLAEVNRQYDQTIKHLLDGLRVFTQLVSPHDYELLLESLNYEFELKNNITQLQECHSSRVSKLRNVHMYGMLKERREAEMCERHLLNDVLHHLKDESACQTWLQRQAAIDCMAKGVAVPLPNASRKAAPPMDVSGLPGFDKLGQREKELCTHIRLIPEAYLEFKTILVNECSRNGSLKLAQARLLIKIDVNKTRKIFDFLVKDGHISKGS